MCSGGDWRDRGMSAFYCAGKLNVNAFCSVARGLRFLCGCFSGGGEKSAAVRDESGAMRLLRQNELAKVLPYADEVHGNFMRYADK